PQRLAAAAISISRADAPMACINPKNPVVLSLLPVNCQLIRGLRYAGAVGENSILTRLQSAPSSSASTAGRVVIAPCPISDCEEMSVTTSYGLMRIHGLRGALSGTTAAPADSAVAPSNSAFINEPISK